MLHRNFIDVIAYIKSKKMRCSITTNGFLLERYASDITRLGLDRIRISLDGPEEIHNEIRGSRVSYQKAMQGLKAIQKEKDSRNKKVPSIAVNCVITQYNYQRLLDVVDEMAEVGVKTLTFQHLMFDDFTGHGIDVEHFIQMIPALEKKAKQNGIFLTFYPQMNISQIRNYYNNTVAHLGGSCVLPWFVTRVQADGSITCCRDFINGNVMDEDFSVKKIWNNELIGNYRKSIVTNGLFSDCGRCCHRLYIE
jgi:MoaA/NifB/PqqE/SkfB family radical SAM enzyme